MTASTDAGAVRWLAHPMRSRLHRMLQQHGPDTASALARRLQTNSGATSYHLRRLHAAGLVTETATGPGRRRIWQALPVPSADATDPPQPDAEAALAWLDRDVVRHLADQSEHWLDVAAGWPAAWQRATRTSDALVLLTAAQLRTMRTDIDAVISRYRRIGQGNPQAKRVAVYVVSAPVDIRTSPE